jgi:branched-chain amino acid transport system ATP-binding protein
LQTILEVENISKSFGGLQALNHISFDLAEGEILGIIGPNGSGKTTLFSVICGSIKPDSGKVIFLKRDITGKQCHQICSWGIARTYQIVRPFPYLTTLQNVMTGRLFGERSAANMKKAAEDAEEVLDQVGLINKKEMLAKNLTLPDRKRLEVARALATRPKILLLDEVMAGLNASEAENAMTLVRRIRDSGITIMLVEHVIKAITGLSDRLIVLNAGEKLAEGQPQEIINNKSVIEAYLGRESY